MPRDAKRRAAYSKDTLVQCASQKEHAQTEDLSVGDLSIHYIVFLVKGTTGMHADIFQVIVIPHSKSVLHMNL